ncbi:hypothetical protein QWZ06_10410 [Chryseobacterium tructae]|uniref:TonB-dependent receptor plug domain-containing protein n=1 Tax=Chryseobacterium tructae TaxID=1037380 RepID=A0ABV7XVM5_9FLAO|nr:hypothetical protein [Chryseobacterium tructae]MDN3692660.1 hypothetical protein [Chryseobacterium tructae]
MKITIPKPCHESWDSMTYDEKGKFCTICSKTVHDFTRFSDEELINSFDSSENICGRFREDQLGVNLNFSLSSKLALGLLVAGSFMTTVNAQETKLGKAELAEKASGVNMFVISNHPFNIDPSVRIGAPAVIKTENRPFILLNGKKASLEELRAIKPDIVDTIYTLSGKEAIEQYGEKAKNGAIIITTKKKRKRA